MLYIRISLMKPKRGQEREVASMMDDLVAFYREQDGFVDGFKLMAADEMGDIGRVTVWKSEAAADATAQMEHVLSVRSRLNPLVEEGSHDERSFHAEEAAKPLSELVHRLGL